MGREERRDVSESDKEASPLLRVEDVARRVGTTPDTVRRWLREGKLRGVRPGGTKLGWRIRASEVDRLLSGEERDRPPTGAAA
jgi:excisionase family DNA binding protein